MALLTIGLECLSCWPAMGAISFAPKIDYPVGGSTQSIVLFDSDGDTDIDVAGANTDSSRTYLLKNNGAGLLGLPTDYMAGPSPTKICAADFDGDSRLDIGVIHSASGIVYILRNTGVSFSVMTADTVPGIFNSLCAANLFWDTTPELVAGGGGIVKVFRLFGGAFAGAPTSYFSDGGRDSWSMYPADVEGDGDLDLLMASSITDEVFAFNNSGFNDFWPPYPPPPLSYFVHDQPLSVCASDITGDDRPEVFTANYGSSNISVLTNNGSGGFLSAWSLPAQQSPTFVITADLDGDGDLDLATTNALSNSVSVISNQGGGTFSSAINFPVRSFPYCVQAADMNGDGKLDLVTASLSGYVCVLLNTTVNSCCSGSTGNVDCDPADATDISDLSALIDNLYFTFAPLCCFTEANVDGQTGIDISDLSALIDYLYITFSLPAVCQ